MKEWHWVALAVAVIALGFGGKKVYDMTRGLRNNNPGNIRHSSAQWQGMSATQTDSAFVQFTESKWGIRALAVLLGNYARKHGLTTVRGIISRYAPSTENNTAAYVGAVASALGVGADQSFDVINRMGDLIRAIIKHENGLQPYSVAELNAGLSLASMPTIKG